MKNIYRNNDDWFYDFMGADGLSEHNVPEPFAEILYIVGNDEYPGPKDPVEITVLLNDTELKQLLDWCEKHLPNWKEDGEIPLAWETDTEFKKGHIYRYEDGGILFCDKLDCMWVLSGEGAVNDDLAPFTRIYKHPKYAFSDTPTEVPLAKATASEKKLISKL